MSTEDLIMRFGVALAAGLVVGVERGWRDRDAPAGSRTAGVRTYGLSALLGAVVAAVGAATGSPLVPAAGLATFAAAFAWFKSREAAHERGFSVTDVVAALAVFGVGALAVAGDPVAAAAGVAVAGILASREFLHGLLKRMTWAELRSALLLLAMTVVAMPLLPNRAVDPFGGVVPREIWGFTVLTAGISYAGCVGVKVAGPARGLLISSLAGALASSTAVTLAYARRAAAGEPSGTLSGGAALAALVSILRVLCIVAVVTPRLLALLTPPALAGAGAFGAAALVLLRRGGAAEAGRQTVLGNPFDLKPLLAFAAAFAAVAFAAAWLTSVVGSGALLASSGVFGVLDVDVATLTAARLAGVSVPLELAAQAILLALAVNAVARVALAAAGPFTYTGRLLAATALALGAGAAAMLSLDWLAPVRG